MLVLGLEGKLYILCIYICIHQTVHVRNGFIKYSGASACVGYYTIFWQGGVGERKKGRRRRLRQRKREFMGAIRLDGGGQRTAKEDRETEY